MAFYFALFNVSSVNLEENAKKNKYKELKKNSSRQRCRSADGRMKAKIQLSSDAKQMQVRRVPNKNLHKDVGGSLESLHHKNKSSNDYRSQLSKPQVVEVYNGRKISAPTAITQLPRSRLTSATDSVGTATSLANGDIRKDDDFAFERTGVNLARRGSTPSYKRVTFRYSGDATTTVTLREEPSISQELERISKYPLSKEHPAKEHPANEQPANEQPTPTTTVAQNSSSTFSSRFLGKLSCTSPKIKRHATWHLANSNNSRRQQSPISMTTTLILPKTSTSPLNKLRAIIKKLIVENRRKKIINSLKQAAVLYQQQEQTENERRILNQQQQTTKWPSDQHHQEPLANGNLALETLQNMQNQTMEENLKDQRRSTSGTAPLVHRHSLFGQSWSRREEQLASTEKEDRRWSTTMSLRRTPSANCSNKRNSMEIKMKRQSATIMETDLSTENVNSSNNKNPQNQIRASEKSNRPSKNSCRMQSKEKEQPNQQQQEIKNQNQVVRRRSTTDKSRSPSTFKNLGAWALLKSKRRSCSSTSQQSCQTDEECCKLLPIYDENRNQYFSNNDDDLRRQLYGWVPPINGYVNPLFVSLSAPNSPAHVRMREKKKVNTKSNKCKTNKRIDQRISLIETDLTCNQRNGQTFPKPKNSWWHRAH